jgi:imidazolonepropionase-like amidohydrolase
MAAHRGAVEGQPVMRAGIGALTVLLAQASFAATPTVVLAARLIDGTGAAAQGPVAVEVVDNRITAVHARAHYAVPAGSRVIDLGAATLLPGLIDTHIHLFLQGELPEEGGYDAQLLKHPQSFRAPHARWSRRGVHSIRGLRPCVTSSTEGAGYGDVGIKEAIEAGDIPGPRLYVATRSISTTRGLSAGRLCAGDQRPKRCAVDRWPRRRAARRRGEQLDTGADWIKVYMTHRRGWTTRDGS